MRREDMIRLEVARVVDTTALPNRDRLKLMSQWQAWLEAAMAQVEAFRPSAAGEVDAWTETEANVNGICDVHTFNVGFEKEEDSAALVLPPFVYVPEDEEQTQ